MGIFATVENILARRNAGQLAEFAIEVRLIGITGFQSDVYPPASRLVKAIPQGSLESKKTRVNPR